MTVTRLDAGTSPRACAAACDGGGDPLLAIPFEDLVRRRLQPVVQTLANGQGSGPFFHEVLQQVERALVGLALDCTGGNQQRAAGILGISRNTLRTKWGGAPSAPAPGDGNGAIRPVGPRALPAAGRPELRPTRTGNRR